MDTGASDAYDSVHDPKSSLKAEAKEVEGPQPLLDAANNQSEEECLSSGKARTVEPDQGPLNVEADLGQELSVLVSKGKSRDNDCYQKALESVVREEFLRIAKGKGKSAEYKIEFDIYSIPGQSGAESIVAHLGDPVEHTGVTCDGPLCAESQSYIKGLRYKCTVCDDVDFCSECIATFNNNHNATHAMVKCILPTTFTIHRNINNDSKKALLSSCKDAVIPDDLTHVVLADTKDSPFIESILASLPEVLETAAFAICRPSVDATKCRASRFVEINTIPADDRFVTQYKIDEDANVRVQHQPYGAAPAVVREEVVMHHQDAKLLMKVVLGEISQFRYPSKDKVYHDAWAGRPATRVIDLKPGRFEDKLECNVRAVDLSEGPVYEALSYTWKETAYARAHASIWTKEVDETFRSMSQYSHAVYCGNSFIKVNVGLRDALRRLRDPVETKTYWIDQLSIDQNNLSERAFQVQGIEQVYNRARRVIVWTGDEDEDTKPAFDIIRKLATARNVSEQLAFSPEELVSDQILDLPALDSSEWRSLLRFFFRPVFERMWVIQEIVAAQQVVIRCGDDEITWSELSRTASLLSSNQWLKALPFKEVYKEPLNNQSRLGHIIMLNGFREDFHNLKELSMESLLYNTSIFEASDPRDRIFALLGIRGAKLNPETAEDIEVNYVKSIRDVFIETTKAVIMRENSLNICSMNGSVSNKTCTGLPSWVPDYTSGLTKYQVSFGKSDPPSPYSASGNSEAVAIWPYEEQGHILVTSSYKAGIISVVSQTVLSDNSKCGPLIAEWTSIASRCGPNYVTGEFTPDVFWRTCIADATPRWRQSPAPLSYHGSLSTFFSEQIVQHAASEMDPKSVERLMSEQDLGDVHWRNPVIGTLAQDAEKSASDADHGDDAAKNDPEAIGAFLATCRNRRFFMTANNYLGLGPGDAQVGDEVHLLSGARIPFVLRKINSGDISLPDEHDPELQPYVMIGETYVHGLMKGEALKDDAFEWNGICLC